MNMWLCSAKEKVHNTYITPHWVYVVFSRWGKWREILTLKLQSFKKDNRDLTWATLSRAEDLKFGTRSAASCRAMRLLHFAASASNPVSPFSRINPMHCSPRLSVNITRSTGLRQECAGAILAAQRKSKSSFRKTAIKETCTDTYVSLWLGPPSL